MNNQQMADKTTNFIVKIIFFLMMLGTLGLVKLFYNREIREKANYANVSTFPKRLFDFKGRAGRLEFFILQIGCLIVLYLAMFFVSLFDKNIGSILLILILLIDLVIAIATSTRRCRDLSISPWVLILWGLELLVSVIVPCIGSIIGSILSIALLFLPGGIDFSKTF